MTGTGNLGSYGVDHPDAFIGALAMSWWLAAALVALFLVACVVIWKRDGAGGTLRLAVPTLAAVVGTLVILSLFQRPSVQSRRALLSGLEARAFELTTRALGPASPLACLATRAGDLVQTACEKGVFGTPDATASAVAYVETQIALLADERRGAVTPPTDNGVLLSGVRQVVEADPYGIAAFVLATRYGCRADACPAFAWFTNTARLRDNLAAELYSKTVAKYAGDARDQAPPPPLAARIDNAVGATTAPVPGAPEIPISAIPGALTPTGATPAPSGMDFPSADSIPPVSIMNSEPPVAAPASKGEAKGEGASNDPPPRRAPAQARKSAPSEPPAARSGPMPLVPNKQ